MEKILFIDDNTCLREEVLEALKFEGYDVFGAGDGFEGIEIAKTKKPHLILCDIRMPELDGFEVYRQLQNDTSTALIPFIFLTALAEQDEIRKGMELGADDFIVKPILLEKLLKVICVRLQKSVEINNRIQARLNDLRARVLHTLPHELLTPLNGILGFASLIKDDTESLSRYEIKEMASEIELNGNRLHSIINNYLNYVLISSKNDFGSDNAGLNNIHEIIAKVSIRVAKKYERVGDLMFKLENAELIIDYDDFVFLIRELVDNAFKFSEPKSNVVVMNATYNNHLEIQIQDHGIGFPIDNVSDIGAFNQFNQKKIAQQGSGFGLITSMLITQRYHGTLQISNTTQGTIVKLTLPASPQIPG
ncbi:DNA-binding response regulator, AraC family [Aquipluma nitroreducens]|uniref:histidine kinase n=1 Tax=Aquipluma nitroreducens TaxID=2010828 RepID=A0A5K7S3X4_9BACT|nr:hybrid sensor histidine kinase/response regulator [Aquipluma nitroreducens]BBE16197.1 DNA-binding response regulator, AraC family [Aquipluma nitroreducens]